METSFRPAAAGRHESSAPRSEKSGGRSGAAYKRFATSHSDRRESLPGVETAIGIAVAIGLAPLIEWLLLRSRRSRGRRDVVSGETILEYGRGLRAVTILGTLFLAFLGVLATGAVDPSTPVSDREMWIALALFLPWLVVFIALGVEVFLAYVKVGNGAIARHSPWKGDLSLAWEEIESVQYSTFNRWYVLRSPRGKIRVSSYLSGIDDFVELSTERISADRWRIPFSVEDLRSRIRAR